MLPVLDKAAAVRCRLQPPSAYVGHTPAATPAASASTNFLQPTASPIIWPDASGSAVVSEVAIKHPGSTQWHGLSWRRFPHRTTMCQAVAQECSATVPPTVAATTPARQQGVCVSSQEQVVIQEQLQQLHQAAIRHWASREMYEVHQQSAHNQTYVAKPEEQAQKDSIAEVLHLSALHPTSISLCNPLVCTQPDSYADRQTPIKAAPQSCSAVQAGHRDVDADTQPIHTISCFADLVSTRGDTVSAVAAPSLSMLHLRALPANQSATQSSSIPNMGFVDGSSSSSSMRPAHTPAAVEFEPWSHQPGNSLLIDLSRKPLHYSSQSFQLPPPSVPTSSSRLKGSSSTGGSGPSGHHQHPASSSQTDVASHEAPVGNLKKSGTTCKTGHGSKLRNQQKLKHKELQRFQFSLLNQKAKRLRSRHHPELTTYLPSTQPVTATLQPHDHTERQPQKVVVCTALIAPRPVLHYSINGAPWQAQPFTPVSGPQGTFLQAVVAFSSQRTSASLLQPSVQFYISTPGLSPKSGSTPKGARVHTCNRQGRYWLEGGECTQLLSQPIVLSTDLSSIAGRLMAQADDDACSRLLKLWKHSKTLHSSLLVYNSRRSWKVFHTTWQSKQHVLPEPDVVISSLGTHIAYRLADGSWSQDTHWATQLSRQWDKNVLLSACKQLQKSFDSSHQPAIKLGPRCEQSQHMLCLQVVAELTADVLHQLEEAVQQASYRLRFKAVVQPARGRWCTVYLLPINAGKGGALQYVVRRFGLQQSKVVACGDSASDIEVLQLASNSVAATWRADDDLLRWVREREQEREQQKLRSDLVNANLLQQSTAPRSLFGPLLEQQHTQLGCCNPAGVAQHGLYKPVVPACNTLINQGGSGTPSIAVCSTRPGALALLSGLQELGLL